MQQLLRKASQRIRHPGQRNHSFLSGKNYLLTVDLRTVSALTWHGKEEQFGKRGAIREKQSYSGKEERFEKRGVIREKRSYSGKEELFGKRGAILK